jgi:inner membrane protein
VDNLTHSLVGVLLRRAGLGRGAPRPMLVCVLAANAPDLDLIAGLSPEKYLIWHRHITHGVAAIPLMALAAAALAWLVERLIARLPGRRATPWNWRAAWLTALIPAATHPLLDAMNSYGIRPWLPFSSEWLSFNTLFVVDWVAWALLLVAVLWPLLSNLIANEIGAPGRAGKRAAWAGLVALSLYVGWRGVSHARVVGALDARLWDGAPAKRVAAFPAPFDPREWTGYVETDAFRMTLPVSVARLEDIDRTEGRKVFPPEDRTAVEAAWKTNLGRAYKQFARYPLEIVEPQPEGVRVILSDARFMRLARAGFACVIDLDASGKVIRERFAF